MVMVVNLDKGIEPGNAIVCGGKSIYGSDKPICIYRQKNGRRKTCINQQAKTETIIDTNECLYYQPKK